MLIKIEKGLPVGHPVHETNLRAVFPDLALPALLTPEIVAPLGYGLFEFTQMPVFEGQFDTLVEGSPQQDEAGIWRQVWQIVPMSEDEKRTHEVDLALQIRAERDLRLARSDFSQLADAPAWVDRAQWAAYRQALRDLPAQPGFPFSHTWPVQPE